MTDQDCIRFGRAVTCDRSDKEAVLQALRELSEAEQLPHVISLANELGECLERLQQPRVSPTLKHCGHCGRVYFTADLRGLCCGNSDLMEVPR